MCDRDGEREQEPLAAEDERWPQMEQMNAIVVTLLIFHSYHQLAIVGIGANCEPCIPNSKYLSNDCRAPLRQKATVGVNDKMPRFFDDTPARVLIIFTVKNGEWETMVG